MASEKRYFKIGEVCAAAGIKPHVLRYWEEEIKGIKSFRSLSNQRLYTVESLDRIVRAKKFIDDGFKLDSINRLLDEPPKSKAVSDTVPRSLIDEIKNDLQSIKRLLE